MNSQKSNFEPQNYSVSNKNSAIFLIASLLSLALVVFLDYEPGNGGLLRAVTLFAMFAAATLGIQFAGLRTELNKRIAVWVCMSTVMQSTMFAIGMTYFNNLLFQALFVGSWVSVLLLAVGRRVVASVSRDGISVVSTLFSIKKNHLEWSEVEDVQDHVSPLNKEAKFLLITTKDDFWGKSLGRKITHVLHYYYLQNNQILINVGMYNKPADEVRAKILDGFSRFSGK